MKSKLARIAAIAAVALTACSASVTDSFDRYGLMTRRANPDREVYLIFSADSMFEGGTIALDAMAERGIKASFFFTGNFLRDSVNHPIIRRTIEEGHFVGPHSNGHILLADWEDGRPSLVSPDSLREDTRLNYEELARFGVTEHSWYLPPFEWAAAEHAVALKEMGLTPISPTPGIMTFRDYTTPGMQDYWSSDSMLTQFYQYEREHGLDGAFVIIHLGTQDVRTDKLYYHLPEMLDSLAALGYHPTRL